MVPPPKGVDNYVTLFKDDTSGLFISAAPAFDVIIGGKGTIKGTGSMTAAFTTLANLQIGLDQSGTFSQGFSETVAIAKPTFQNSDLSLDAEVTLSVSIIPKVYWEIGVSYSVTVYPVTTTTTLAADFLTPFSGTYELGEAVVDGV